VKSRQSVSHGANLFQPVIAHKLNFNEHHTGTINSRGILSHKNVYGKRTILGSILGSMNKLPDLTNKVPDHSKELLDWIPVVKWQNRDVMGFNRCHLKVLPKPHGSITWH